MNPIKDMKKQTVDVVDLCQRIGISNRGLPLAMLRLELGIKILRKTQNHVMDIIMENKNTTEKGAAFEAIGMAKEIAKGIGIVSMMMPGGNKNG